MAPPLVDGKQGMGPSKMDLLTQGVTLAMIDALRQYAQEARAGSFTDRELSGLLARNGGSMVRALGHLQTLAERRQGIA